MEKKIGSGRKVRVPATLLAVVPSASNPNLSYEVKQSNVDGVIYCSCPSWKYDMDGKRLVGYARPSKDRSCKHTRAYQAGLLTPPAAAPKVEEKHEECGCEKKSLDSGSIRKTVAYMLKKGAKSEEILKVLKEAGMSELGAWSLLQEVDA